MTDDHGLKIAAAASKITSGGITPYVGSQSASEGFTIGTDSDLNVSAETLFYVAARGSVS